MSDRLDPECHGMSGSVVDLVHHGASRAVNTAGAVRDRVCRNGSRPAVPDHETGTARPRQPSRGLASRASRIPSSEHMRAALLLVLCWNARSLARALMESLFLYISCQTLVRPPNLKKRGTQQKRSAIENSIKSSHRFLNKMPQN